MPRSSGVHPCIIHTRLYHPSAGNCGQKTKRDQSISPIYPGRAYAAPPLSSYFEPITAFVNEVKQEYYLTGKDRSLKGLMTFAIRKFLKLDTKTSNAFSDRLAQQF